MDLIPELKKDHIGWEDFDSILNQINNGKITIILDDLEAFELLAPSPKVARCKLQYLLSRMYKPNINSNNNPLV